MNVLSSTWNVFCKSDHLSQFHIITIMSVMGGASAVRQEAVRIGKQGAQISVAYWYDMWYYKEASG